MKSKTRKLDIVVLVDVATIDPDDPDFRISPDEPVTEYHVIESLRELGHTVRVVGAINDVPGLADVLTRPRPDLVFNLTEHLEGDRTFDKNIASFIEILNLPYTGAGSVGLMLCRDKRLCKELLRLHRIRVPEFFSFAVNKRIRIPKNIHYPLVVKPALEDSSEGISNASLVNNDDALRERVQFVHDRWAQPVIAEEYIDGREFYIAIVGNSRLKVFPPRECFFDHDRTDGPMMATYRVKWNKKYREKWGVHFGFADLEPGLFKMIERISKRVYRVLHLQDYGRIDVRMTPDNKLVILEANPNPDLAYGEEVAEAAEKAGLTHCQLIDRIIYEAMKRYE